MASEPNAQARLKQSQLLASKKKQRSQQASTTQQRPVKHRRENSEKNFKMSGTAAPDGKKYRKGNNSTSEDHMSAQNLKQAKHDIYKGEPVSSIKSIASNKEQNKHSQQQDSQKASDAGNGDAASESQPQQLYRKSADGDDEDGVSSLHTPLRFTSSQEQLRQTANGNVEESVTAMITDEKKADPIEAKSMVIPKDLKQQDQADDLNPPSKAVNDSSAKDESEAEKLREILPTDPSQIGPNRFYVTPPNPLLPKSVKVQHSRAAESNIKGITFRKLKEFKHFPQQATEQLGSQVRQSVSATKHERTKMQSSPSPIKERGNATTNTFYDQSPVQISIEQSRLVRNVVFLRDVTILDNLGKDIKELTQKDVFQHENFIDVKQLIRERDVQERMMDQLETALQRAKRQQQTRIQSQAQNLQVAPGSVDPRTGAYKLASQNDRTLVFESRFESGNLFMAMKLGEQEYDLLMQNDTNTLGHTQWFYFQVKNARAGIPIKFNILNYAKPDSMFNYGMKVSVYSDKKAEEGQVGWHRACSDISYTRNQVRKDNSQRFFYTLTFTYQFDHDQDTVYFAYCFPYSFTDLKKDISEIENNKKRACLIQRSTLCKTLGGLNCELLTITEQMKTDTISSSSTIKKGINKPGVVISARVHPGETVGSWMMRGVLRFLTDPDNEEAKLLRRSFVFQIIPMLNPDGVVNGNYRCSLAGCDLNRRWKFPSKQLQPTVYHTKRLIKKVHSERTCALYCDLHGHSRKPNIFMYGCDVKGSPENTRIFPLVLSKISPLFQFEASRFGVQKSKEATARVAVFKELKTCPLIYTMESTFSGLDIGPYSGMHISTQMLESMGRDLCRALLVQNGLGVPRELENMPTVATMKTHGKRSKTFSAEPSSDTEGQVVNQKALAIKQTLLAELTNNKELLRAGHGDSSSGSDSEPSEDNMEATELIKNLPAVDKTLALALKQEQHARKEASKVKRSSSPNKDHRWRVTTVANHKTEAEADSPVRLRKPRTQAIKLSEIKEEQKDDQSNTSPLKIIREANKNQQQKLDKKRMVDAVTQTERDSNNQLVIKKGPRDRRVPHREPTVQLRIANIQLHESVFQNGIRPSGAQPQHSTVVSNQQSHVTTVNIQGSDFNAVISPGTVHVQQSISQSGQHQHNGSQGMRSESSGINRTRSYISKNIDLASALSFEGQRSVSPKKANGNVTSSVVHVPIQNANFQNYLVNNLEKAVYATDKQKLRTGSLCASKEFTIDSRSRTQTANSQLQKQQTGDSGRSSQSQLLNPQKKQPRIKQLQEFQAVAKAAKELCKQDNNREDFKQPNINNSNTSSNTKQINANANAVIYPYVVSKRDKDSSQNQSLVPVALAQIKDAKMRNSHSVQFSPDLQQEVEEPEIFLRDEKQAFADMVGQQTTKILANGATKKLPHALTAPQSQGPYSKREHYTQQQESVADRGQNSLSNYLDHQIKQQQQVQTNTIGAQNKLQGEEQRRELSRSMVTSSPSKAINQQIQQQRSTQGAAITSFFPNQTQDTRNTTLFQLQPMGSNEALPMLVTDSGIVTQQMQTTSGQVYNTNDKVVLRMMPPLAKPKLQLYLPSRIYSQSMHHRPGRIQTTEERGMINAENFQKHTSTSGNVSLSTELVNAPYTVKPQHGPKITDALNSRQMPGGVRKQIQNNQNIAELYSRVYSQQNGAALVNNKSIPKNKQNIQSVTQSCFPQAGGNWGSNELIQNPELNMMTDSTKQVSEIRGSLKPFAMHASPEQRLAQQWRDRQNVSELQMYKPQMLIQNEQLPNLPKFGSQTELKNQTLHGHITSQPNRVPIVIADEADIAWRNQSQTTQNQWIPKSTGITVRNQATGSNENSRGNHDRDRRTLSHNQPTTQKFGGAKQSSPKNRNLPNRVNQIVTPSYEYTSAYQQAFAPSGKTFVAKKLSGQHSQGAQSSAAQAVRPQQRILNMSHQGVAPTQSIMPYASQQTSPADPRYIHNKVVQAAMSSFCGSRPVYQTNYFSQLTIQNNNKIMQPQQQPPQLQKNKNFVGTVGDRHKVAGYRRK